jgi:hypothetical protein
MNIDEYITMFNLLSNEEETQEFKEQEGGGTTGGGGGAAGGGKGYPSVTKWETGIKRGTANPVKLGKWKDVVTLTRGKANTLL